MKRNIVTRPFSLDATRFMTTLAARFAYTANTVVPVVHLELDSYNLRNGHVRLMGTVEYDGDEQPVQLDVEYSLTSTDQLNQRTYMELFPLFVGPYYDALEEIFGVDFNEYG